MKCSQSTHLLICVSFETNVHHQDWLYSGGTDRPGELCYNFSVLNDFTHVIKIPTWFPDCGSHSPALLNIFISSDTSICSIMAFPPYRNSDHDVVSVFIDFPTNWEWDVLFHHIAYDFSHTDCGTIFGVI